MTIPPYVTYLDTAMMLLEIGSLRLLTDPVFDPAGSSYEAGPVRLEKTGAPATTPAELGRIDAVLLSHDQHPDNFDAAGRAFAATVPAILTTPLAASRLGSAGAIGLVPWQTTVLTGHDGLALRVTATPAQHGPDGTQEASGPVTGFFLQWPGGPDGGLYLSGDTIPFAGTAQIAERLAPVGIAILHMGRVQLPVFGEAQLSMSAQEAVHFATSLQANVVVPIHFEGWRHFTETEDATLRVFRNSALLERLCVLPKGVRVPLS